MPLPVFADPDKLAEAKRLRAEGRSVIGLARHFGCSQATISRATDEGAAARQRERERRKNRDIREAIREAPIHIDRYRATPDEIAARLAEMPRDTRDLTGRFCGGPIPGDPRRRRQPAGARP